MNIVQITTVVTDTSKLEANGKKWIESFSSLVENDNEMTLREGVVAKKTNEVTFIEFGGGPTVKNGFSYEFSAYGNDTKLVYLGAEQDFGHGDIRQLIGDCEVSPLVQVLHLTVENKAWPK